MFWGAIKSHLIFVLRESSKEASLRAIIIRFIVRQDGYRAFVQKRNYIVYVAMTT